MMWLCLYLQSTRALHATAEALDDRQKVLEEFEGLRVSHLVSKVIHNCFGLVLRYSDSEYSKLASPYRR